MKTATDLKNNVRRLLRLKDTNETSRDFWQFIQDLPGLNEESISIATTSSSCALMLLFDYFLCNGNPLTKRRWAGLAFEYMITKYPALCYRLDHKMSSQARCYDLGEMLITAPQELQIIACRIMKASTQGDYSRLARFFRNTNDHLSQDFLNMEKLRTFFYTGTELVFERGLGVHIATSVTFSTSRDESSQINPKVWFFVVFVPPQTPHITIYGATQSALDVWFVDIPFRNLSTYELDTQSLLSNKSSRLTLHFKGHHWSYLENGKEIAAKNLTIVFQAGETLRELANVLAAHDLQSKDLDSQLQSQLSEYVECQVAGIPKSGWYQDDSESDGEPMVLTSSKRANCLEPEGSKTQRTDSPARSLKSTEKGEGKGMQIPEALFPGSGLERFHSSLPRSPRKLVDKMKGGHKPNTTKVFRDLMKQKGKDERSKPKQKDLGSSGRDDLGTSGRASTPSAPQDPVVRDFAPTVAKADGQKFNLGTSMKLKSKLSMLLDTTKGGDTAGDLFLSSDAEVANLAGSGGVSAAVTEGKNGFCIEHAPTSPGLPHNLHHNLHHDLHQDLLQNKNFLTADGCVKPPKSKSTCTPKQLQVETSPVTMSASDIFDIPQSPPSNITSPSARLHKQRHKSPPTAMPPPAKVTKKPKPATRAQIKAEAVKQLKTQKQSDSDLNFQMLDSDTLHKNEKQNMKGVNLSNEILGQLERDLLTKVNSSLPVSSATRFGYKSQQPAHIASILSPVASFVHGETAKPSTPSHTRSSLQMAPRINKGYQSTNMERLLVEESCKRSSVIHFGHNGATNQGTTPKYAQTSASNRKVHRKPELGCQVGPSRDFKASSPPPKRRSEESLDREASPPKKQKSSLETECSKVAENIPRRRSEQQARRSMSQRSYAVNRGGSPVPFGEVPNEDARLNSSPAKRTFSPTLNPDPSNLAKEISPVKFVNFDRKLDAIVKARPADPNQDSRAITGYAREDFVEAFQQHQTKLDDPFNNSAVKNNIVPGDPTPFMKKLQDKYNENLRKKEEYQKEKELEIQELAKQRTACHASSSTIDHCPNQDENNREEQDEDRAFKIWEASLKPHNKRVLDLLGRMARTFVLHFAATESSLIRSTVANYTRDGTSVIETMHMAHRDQAATLLRDSRASIAALCEEYARVGRKSRGIAREAEDLVESLVGAWTETRDMEVRLLSPRV